MTVCKRSTALVVLPAVLALIGLASSHARAEDITFNYAGNALSNTFCNGPACAVPTFPTTDSLNLSITFNGPLAPNLSNADLSADIVSWAVDDADGYIDEAFSGYGTAAAGSCPISSTQACLETFPGDYAALYEPSPGVTFAHFSTDSQGNVLFAGGDDFEVIVKPLIYEVDTVPGSVWGAVFALQPPSAGSGVQIDFSPGGDFYGQYANSPQWDGCNIEGYLGQSINGPCQYSSSGGTWSEVPVKPLSPRRSAWCC